MPLTGSVDQAPMRRASALPAEAFPRVTTWSCSRSAAASRCRATTKRSDSGYRRGQGAPDPLDALQPLGGRPGGQPGLERVVAGQHHEAEGAPGEARRGQERLEVGERRLDGRVVARPELGDARLRDPLEQERQAGALHRHGGDHVDPQRGGEPVGVDADPAGGGLVGHVERQREGDAGLGELAGEQEPAPEVLGVAHLKADVLRLAEQDVAGHLLVLGHGEQVVGARGVEHVPAQAADLGRAPRDLHGGARVVRDGDVLAGERAEEDALADVGVAHQHQRARGGHDLLVVERLAAGGGARRGGHGRSSLDPGLAAAAAVAATVELELVALHVEAVAPGHALLELLDLLVLELHDPPAAGADEVVVVGAAGGRLVAGLPVVEPAGHGDPALGEELHGPVHGGHADPGVQGPHPRHQPVHRDVPAHPVEGLDDDVALPGVLEPPLLQPGPEPGERGLGLDLPVRRPFLFLDRPASRGHVDNDSHYPMARREGKRERAPPGRAPGAERPRRARTSRPASGRPRRAPRRRRPPGPSQPARRGPGGGPRWPGRTARATRRGT